MELEKVQTVPGPLLHICHPSPGLTMHLTCPFKKKTRSYTAQRHKFWAVKQSRKARVDCERRSSKNLVYLSSLQGICDLGREIRRAEMHQCSVAFTYPVAASAPGPPRLSTPLHGSRTVRTEKTSIRFVSSDLKVRLPNIKLVLDTRHANSNIDSALPWPRRPNCLNTQRVSFTTHDDYCSQVDANGATKAY
ncbi:hypothetical protein CBL_06885 [Carabus blaptoides fortunei]